MIHEGTHGIQAMDLLGRKVLMEDGKGLALLAQRMQASMERAASLAGTGELGQHAKALGQALQKVGDATRATWATGNPHEALANAVPYLQAFGHTVLAWMWLDVACTALQKDPSCTHAATTGRLGAARYFFHYELPRIDAWLGVVSTRDTTCADFPEAAF